MKDLLRGLFGAAGREPLDGREASDTKALTKLTVGIGIYLGNDNTSVELGILCNSLTELLVLWGEVLAMATA